MATTAKRTPRRTTSGRSTKTTSKPASSGSAIEGAEQIVEALDTEIRLRVSASVLVAVAIIVVLIILGAATSANMLFALPAIALSFAAGWLVCRSTGSSTD